MSTFLRRAVRLRAVVVNSLVFLLIAAPASSSLFAQENETKIPITTSSEEAKALYIEARDLQEKFHFPESREPLAQALALDENFALAHLLFAFTEPSNKGFLESFNKAVALKDQVSEGERLLILARQAGVNGHPLEQGDYLLTLVEKYPQDERAHTQLALFYFGQQRFPDAIVHFTEATEANPDFSAAYNMLGYSHRSLEQYEEAEKAFKKYTELLPDEANPLDSYAELLLKMGRYDEALDSYRKVLQLDPTFVASYVGAASTLTCMNRHDDARAELNKMKEAAVNDGQRRFALLVEAATYCDEKRFNEAIVTMKQQYQIAENIRDAGAMAQDMINMGNIFFQEGRYDDAMGQFSAALTIIRESNLSDDQKANAERFYIYNEGRVALKKGDMETAKAKSADFLTQAENAHNNFQIWLAHQLAGMIAYEDGDYEKALAEYEDSNPQNPHNLYRIALTYQKLGNKEKAIEYCTKAANFNSLLTLNYAFARPDATALLAELKK